MTEQSPPSNTPSPAGLGSDSSSREYEAMVTRSREPAAKRLPDITKGLSPIALTKCGCGEDKNEAADACETCLERWRLRRGWSRASGIKARHTEISSWPLLAEPVQTSKHPDAVAKFQQAVAMIREFLNRPEGATFLALIGNRGTGKTQLSCVAVYQSIFRDREARRRDTVDLMSDLKRRFGGDGDADGDWLREWERPWLLCLDEFQDTAESVFSTVTLKRMLNGRYEKCRRTILIANVKDAGEFAELVGPRISDRCREAGGVIVCDWPSFRGAT